jgi:ATP-dependent DNA helicase RecG
MNEEQLRQLMSLPAETEWLEFKEAKQQEKFDDVGRYFSALSNEANIAKQKCGWLILGVTDKPPRTVTGTHYCHQPPGLERLKKDISLDTNHKLTFTDIHELTIDSGRVLAFEIPPAPRGVPTTWREAPYGRIFESLGYLALNKIDTIRSQAADADWSAQPCDTATLDDLHSEAVASAREKFKAKNPQLAEEIDDTDNLTFLTKAKLAISGRLTRAALILLGKPESTHHLSPAVVKMSWLLRDEEGNTKDYVHFEPPFLLNSERLFGKIRNLTYRYMPPGTLIPTEVSQYDPWVIREALHNCIAHQNYESGGQTTVIEEEDTLLLSNPGEFIPGTVDEVLRRNAPSEVYRNRCLADAMVQLKMIDTVGSGIRKMFITQKKRFFPLPDYDLSRPNQVSVRLHGRILDPKYTRALIMRTDLDLMDVVALDRVQKGIHITAPELKSLRCQHLIEGRQPNIHVSAEIAAVTDTSVDYLKMRGMDKQWCWGRIVELLKLQRTATKDDFRRLLLDKISDTRTPVQKEAFLKNLLQEMRRAGLIEPSRRGQNAGWQLSKSEQIDDV